MKRHYKYMQKVKLKHGMIWVINPSKAVRKALGVGYEKYDTYQEAKERSVQIELAFDDYKRTQRPTKKLHIEEDTVDSLFQFYTSRDAFQSLSENSKRTYRFLYKTASDLRIGQSNIPFGRMLIKSVNAKTADDLFLTLRTEKSDHRANSVVKVLRRVWFVGRRGILGDGASNPFQQMGLKKLNIRRTRWMPEDVDAFVSKADELGYQSIGTLALLCYDLCQRPGDMRKMVWGNFDGEVFAFTQEKTETPLTLELSPRLSNRFADIVRGKDDEYIVNYEATGRPYDMRMYAKVAQHVRTQAKLSSDLQIRDLRRSGATEMGEAGCTEDEIAAVTGHTSRQMLEIYVNPTRKIASRGMQKRWQNA
jgi:integrase